VNGSCEVMIGLVVMLAFKIALQVVHTDCFTVASFKFFPSGLFILLSFEGLLSFEVMSMEISRFS
jgi:hypothetical protein